MFMYMAVVIGAFRVADCKNVEELAIRCSFSLLTCRVLLYFLALEQLPIQKFKGLGNSCALCRILRTIYCHVFRPVCNDPTHEQKWRNCGICVATCTDKAHDEEEDDCATCSEARVCSICDPQAECDVGGSVFKTCAVCVRHRRTCVRCERVVCEECDHDSDILRSCSSCDARVCYSCQSQHEKSCQENRAIQMPKAVHPNLLKGERLSVKRTSEQSKPRKGRKKAKYVVKTKKSCK